MAELTDYAADFDSHLRFQDFSRDVLVKLLGMYARIYQRLDGFWYMSVKERVSNEEAVACDLWVWKRQVRQEMKNLTRLLKIEVDGVVSAMKALQVSPWGFSHKFSAEFPDDNTAILTFTYCPALEALETEAEGREQTICGVVDLAVKREFAAFFGPGIKVTPLKLPPRESGEDICCQWEFRLE